jgi:phosphatidylglycerol---prolipoprotein diacylglyceryl transferase
MSALAAALPYFHLGSLDLGVPIQSFGVIVATGVLIGAALLRRYAEWHGVDDEHIRGITGWITVAGFIGAHVFDVIAYQWNDLMNDPLLFVEVWKGISSYGGFIGGAAGFAIYVWWKRLPARLFADIGIVGLLPAFSIGRIGCTVVSDHIGAAVDPDKWYSFLAMDYPRTLNLAHLAEHYPGASEFVRAWNLGLIELLYLIPVNILILWLAFRTKKRPNAGLLIVLAGMLYAPVRFGLDFLRPEETDPRYAGLTFAQWASIVALGVAVYVAVRVIKHGAPAEIVAPTSGEAQAKLKSIVKETADAKDAGDDDGDDEKPKSKKSSKSK